jgi:hypothetical protein
VPGRHPRRGHSAPFRFGSGELELVHEQGDRELDELYVRLAGLDAEPT